MRRTRRVVRQRRALADHRAANILRNHPVARHWAPSATFVLGAMMLYGWQTGVCCASQRNIGRAAGLSRQQTHTWIHRLIDEGIVTVVGYDWRGTHYQASGYSGEITRWCLVIALPAARMPFAALTPAIGESRDSVKPCPKPPDSTIPKVAKPRPPPRKKKPGPVSKLLWDFPEPGEYHFQQVQKRAEREHYNSVVNPRRE